MYKKAENAKGALHYLMKALDMQIQNSYDATNVASTHLNISAILSSMGDHESSLAHALASLKTLQSVNFKTSNFAVSIIIAYHSIGIENEFLRKTHDAVAAYKKGWDIAEKELGPSHKLTESLKKSFAKVSNLPTMPILRPIKRIIKKKRTSSQQKDFFPTISSRNSNNGLFNTPKQNLNKSSEHSLQRYSLYTAKVKNSLSPVVCSAKSEFVADLSSINRLIRELDGAQPKQRIKLIKSTHKTRMSAIIRIQKH